LKPARFRAPFGLFGLRTRGSTKRRGAVGFSLLDGTFYDFRAPAVILATGSQNYRMGPMWSNGRGDGIAAAYRAGAKLRNTEFGNFAQLVKVRSHEEVVFGENSMYNARGEFITKNFREHPESDINSNAVAEWYRQMNAGTGPVHLEFGEEGGNKDNPLYKLWDRPYGQRFWQLNTDKNAAVDRDLEVCPMFIGEQSPVMVGHDMQTSVPGLFAAGDASYCGSAMPGAVPAPPGRNRGSGILNAVFEGMLSAASAARTAREMATAGADADDADIDAQAAAFREALYAPIGRSKAQDPGVTAKDVIRLVQKAVVPMENSVIMTDARIRAALATVSEAEALLPRLCAEDWHGLLSCREAEAMVLSATMHFRASLMRKESRGWFLREDYPQTDNKNWLKWIIVQCVDGEMQLSTMDVPVDSYANRPEA
jgi:succinate dehydrogenase/fumarate reductase flavoprotein subunit